MGSRNNQVQSKATSGGIVEFTDNSTGEVIQANIIDVDHPKDINFHKVWLGHVLEALDQIGNQKIRVLTYMLDNMDSNNLIIRTQREIAAGSGVGLTTVNATISALCGAGFIRKKGGAYAVAPTAIFRGKHKARMNVLIRHQAEYPDEDE